MSFLPSECATSNECCPMYLTGFCLLDGTPITIIIENSVQTGWINMETGVFTTGAPPAGIVQCGPETRPLECNTDSVTVCPPVSGTFDVNVVNQSTAQTIAEVEGVASDAFGRLRTSQPSNIHDFKHLFFTGILTFANVGNGTVTHDPNRAGAVLSIGTTAGHIESHIKHAPIPYQPGRSQLCYITGVFGVAKANVARRMGLVGEIARNDGIYLEQRGTDGVFLVIRSSASGSPVSTTDVEQANWNLDPLDGTGPSGAILDLANDQIFVIDFHWLSAGRVRFGFDIGGRTVYVHQVIHSNSSPLPFTKTPNFRTFWQIENLNTSASPSDMLAISVSVASEGGRSINGRSQGISTGVNPISVGNAALVPVLAIRPRLTYNGLVNKNIATLREVFLYTDQDIIYEIRYFPSAITGGAWVSMTDNSMMEYNISATSITGGQLFEQAFLFATQNNRTSSFTQNPNVGEREVMSLTGDDAGQVAFVILARRLTAGTANVRAALRWVEERQ